MNQGDRRRRRLTIAGLMGLVLVSALGLAAARSMDREMFALFSYSMLRVPFLALFFYGVFGILQGIFAILRWLLHAERKRRQSRSS